MATNEAVLDHLATIRSAVNSAINNVNRYANNNTDMLSASKASSLTRSAIIRLNCSAAIGFCASSD